MSETFYNFISIDLAPLLTAVFAAISCALLGNFLILRKLSLMGDAISHAVLPGIVVAFLVSSSRASLPMFIGASLSGLFASVLIQSVSKLGKVEPSAAMGVVFSILFASGVILLEQAAARHVDLDPDCVLHGQLEHIFWFPAKTWSGIFSTQTLQLIPRELSTSFFISCVVLAFILLFYKELKISSFDPALAYVQGISPGLMHYLLIALVTLAVVASFEAVGSILVISMLICPAACARLLTQRLKMQILLSAVLGIFCALSGYIIGAFGPSWLGSEKSVSAAGMIAVVSGITLAFCAVFSPGQGILVKRFRLFCLSIEICYQDLLALMYRAHEQGEGLGSPKFFDKVRSLSQASKLVLFMARRRAISVEEISLKDETPMLTQLGLQKAASLVRTHRLWETFLVKQAGIRSDHVHRTAEELEHFTTSEMAEQLFEQQDKPEQDPHQRKIPEKA